MLEKVWRKGNHFTLLVGMRTFLHYANILHYGEQREDSFKTWKQNCHTTQKSHCWAYMPRKPEFERDTCTPLFITALFTIARTWKQPRCLSADKWIRKLYIYTMKYYSAIKKNAFESVLMRWMNLEPILPSEVSQKEKDKYHILMHI